MHQPSCPVVSSVLLADLMGKSFPQNDTLMKVITMASSNYYYALGLIVGQLLDISRFPQVFTLLRSNLLKSWNNKQLLKEAVQLSQQPTHSQEFSSAPLFLTQGCSSKLLNT